LQGRRSALIDRAIRHYVKTQSKQNLRERLKQEALTNAERDLLLAAEWFPLEEEDGNSLTQEKEKIVFPRRGEIYLVHFDPTVGHEIQKTRPAVVIQNDVSNQYSPITIVAALSSQFADPPFSREVVIEPGENGC
jgi:hypothetical protein